MATVAEYEQMVKSPGRVEGEERWCPYFWDQVLERAVDDSGEDYDVFTIEDADCELFPELQGYHSVTLTYSEDGFVYGYLNENIPDNPVDIGGEG